MKHPNNQPSETSSPHMLFKASWQDGTRSFTQTLRALLKPLGLMQTPCSPLVVTRADRPRLWWLMPWTHARHWHQAAVALKALSDMDDRLISRLQAENASLRSRVFELEDGLDRLNDIIVSGGAVVPDAEPVERRQS